MNYIKVLEYIDKLGEEKIKDITEKNILKIHQINTKDILPEEQSGHYRKIPVAVVNGLGEVVLQPSSVNKIPGLMKDFVSWLNSDSAYELYPVTYYELL